MVFLASLTVGGQKGKGQIASHPLHTQGTGVIKIPNSVSVKYETGSSWRVYFY